MTLRERLTGPRDASTPRSLQSERLLASVFQWSICDRLDMFKVWCWRVSNERGPLSWLGDMVDELVAFINARRAYVKWRKENG